MADSSKTAPSANQSVLLPQGDHAGKAALPLGHHAFTLVGSRNRAHLHLLSSTVSRNHACIITTKSGMYIRDLASRAGVIVNSRRVKELDLQDGDIIQIGSFKFKFQEPLGAIRLSTTPPPPLAMLEMAGRTLTPLDDRTVLIGRRSTCDIPIDSATVSSSHAIIFESDGRRYIRDLGSRTGTQVNGTTVHQQALQVGDQIQVGDVRFRYVTTSTPIEEAEEVPESIAIEDEVADFKSDEQAIPVHADVDDGPIPLPVDAEEEVATEPVAEETLDVEDERAVREELAAHDVAPIGRDEFECDEPLPVEGDEEDATASVAGAPLEELQEPEAAPLPVSAQDDLVETRWGPLDFTSTESPLESISVASASPDHGLTGSVGAVETGQDLGLDFWSPDDDQVVTAEAPPAAETPEVAEAEAMPGNEAPEAVEPVSAPVAAEPSELVSVPESRDDEFNLAPVETESASLESAPAAGTESHLSATDADLDAFEAALLELDAPQADRAVEFASADAEHLASTSQATHAPITPFATEEESFAAEPEPLASGESSEEPEPLIPAAPLFETPASAVSEVPPAEGPAGWDDLELLDDPELVEDAEVVADSESIEWTQPAEPVAELEESEWEVVEDSEWVATPAPELAAPVEPEPAPALELGPTPELPVVELPPIPTIDAELAFEQQPPAAPVTVDLTQPTPPLKLEAPAADINTEPARVSRWAKPRDPEEIIADLAPLAAVEPEPVAEIEVEPAAAWQPEQPLEAEPQPVVADLAPISAVELESSDEQADQSSAAELESPVEQTLPDAETSGFTQTVTYSPSEHETVTSDVTGETEALEETSTEAPVEYENVPTPELESAATSQASVVDVEVSSAAGLESPVEQNETAPPAHDFVQTVTFSAAEPESVTTDVTQAAENLPPEEISEVPPGEPSAVPALEDSAQEVVGAPPAAEVQVTPPVVAEEPTVFPPAVQVEDVDLSAMKFEAEQAPVHQPTEVLEAAPETSAEPTPLLDLVPHAAPESLPEIIIPQTVESAADAEAPNDAIPAETAPPAIDKKARKPRAPRKKAATPPARPSSRKKRGAAAVTEIVAEATAPVDDTPPVAPALDESMPVVDGTAAAESVQVTTDAAVVTSAASETIDSDYAVAELLEPESVVAGATPAEPESAKPQAAAMAEVAEEAVPADQASQAQLDSSVVEPGALESELTADEPERLAQEAELPEPLVSEPEELVLDSEAGESEPAISPAGLETPVFYSGTEADVKPVAVEPDQIDLELVDEPAAMAEHSEVSGSEILSFAAAPMTPEAQTVMADWQSSEAEPISFESQPVGTDADAAGDVPEVAAMESQDLAAEETSHVTPEPLVTASVHEQVVSLDAEPTVDVTVPGASSELEIAEIGEISSAPSVTSPAFHGQDVLPESASVVDAGFMPAEVIVTGEPIETIENTEPTFESALALEPSLEQGDAPAAEGEMIQVDPALSDTAFGRAVQDFTGSGLGPLVESTQAKEHGFSAQSAASQPGGEFDSGGALNIDDIELVSTPTPNDDFGSFADALDGLVEAETVAPPAAEPASLELSDGLDAPVDADLMAEASELSADLSAEVPDQSQSLTGDIVLEHAATLDITPVVSEITVTTTEAIEAPLEFQSEDDEFIPIGEDALLEAFDPEDLLQGEQPATEPAISPAAEPLSEAQSPLDLEAREAPPQDIPLEETVVVEQSPAVAEPPAAVLPPLLPPLVSPPPAPKAPTNPYFGMERDLGSFLGGMPLNLPPAIATTPFASGPSQQARPGPNLPPPRLSPVSLPEVKAPPEASFKPAAPQRPISVQRLGMEQQPGVVIQQMRAQQPPVADAPATIQKTILSQPEPLVEPPLVSNVQPPTEDAEAPLELPPELDELPTLIEEPLEAVDPDDLLFKAEEPLELFEGTAEQLDVLPDDFEAIEDVSQVLADAKPAAAARAPQAAPAPAGHNVPAPEAQTLTAAPAVAKIPAGFASGTPSVSVAPPLRSLTADPALTQASAPAASIAVPPFAGAKQDARISLTGFAGMPSTARRLSASDIFSQTAFPPTDEAMFRPQPIDIPPTTVRTPGAGASSGGKLSAEQRRPGTPPGQRGGASAGQSEDKPKAKQTAEELAPKPLTEEKRRKPWWKSIRLLLPLLIVAIAGAIAAIVLLLPPRPRVQGTLHIEGLDSLNPLDRKRNVQDIRKVLAKPDLYNTVAGYLHNKSIPLGFTEDPTAVAAFANPENSDFEPDHNTLVLHHASVDPKNDRTRMQAILLAAYNENRAPAEAARAAEIDQVRESEKKLDALQTQLDSRRADLAKLTDALRVATGTSSQELLQNPAAADEKLQHENEALGNTLTAANSKVAGARKALLIAQAGSEAALSGAPTDPKLAQMKLNLSSLTTRVTLARGLPDHRIEKLADGLDVAVGAADQDLMLLALGSSQDPTLTAYVASGRQAAADIHDILSRQKRNAQELSLLRAQLASRRATHLRQVWEADETLKQMMEDRDAQARRYAAAASSDASSVDEAAKLRSVVDDLDQKIDARRLALATGGQDDVQQTIELAIDHIATDRKTAMQTIAKDVSNLDVPPVGKLQAGAQGAVTSVGKEVAGVKAAHDQYAAAAKNASAKDSNVQIQLLEDDIAEQQARLDAYQRRQDTTAAVAAAWKSLDAAQDAEAKSQTAFAANVNLLASVGELKDATARVEDSKNALATAQADLDRLKTEATHTVQVQPPDEAATSIVYEPDQRTWYVIGALCILGGIFGGPIWMSLRDSESNVPLAQFAAQHPESSEEDFDPFEISTVDEEGQPATA